MARIINEEYKFLLEYLEANGPTPQGEVIADLAPRVQPGRAMRQYERRHPNSKLTDLSDMVASGQRDIILNRINQGREWGKVQRWNDNGTTMIALEKDAPNADLNKIIADRNRLRDLRETLGVRLRLRGHSNTCGWQCGSYDAPTCPHEDHGK